MYILAFFKKYVTLDIVQTNPFIGYNVNALLIMHL